MDKKVKRPDKENTNTVSGTQIDSTNINNTNNVKRDSLRNYTSRPLPMTPKAGVTLRRRRYNCGGKYGR